MGRKKYTRKPGEALSGENPVCSQCGVDRQHPTPEQGRKLAPVCWRCRELYALSRGETPPPLYPGCRDCQKGHLWELTCPRCGVWLHWTGLIRGGAVGVPLDAYAAGFLEKYAAVFGEPAWLRPYGINFLVQLFWDQRAFEARREPLPAFAESSYGKQGPWDRFKAELKTVYGFGPELEALALRRFEQEVADRAGWEKQRQARNKPSDDMTPAGDVAKDLVKAMFSPKKPDREPGEEG